MNEEDYERTASSFHRRIETIANAVDTMAPGLATATSLLTQAMLDDRKILVCACGRDATLASHVAVVLRTPMDAAPALPAIALHSDSDSGDAGHWRDLRTLSRDGDILLSIDTRSDIAVAQKYIQFAETRNLVVISLSEKVELSGGACIELHAEDQDLRSELAFMASHCLREHIKQMLLGE
ncbi:phosphoheptose isomerase [Congregibacter brevis]|uniref:Phosphoheptose isomerase n=1 Tax=Congregibacter brevis TaxID=3081201 RepID=A0ABZ0IH20_9GAMM|nr:phosphoheptose isomerase [Congregibacter sp. IMCC45268]